MCHSFAFRGFTGGIWLRGRGSGHDYVMAAGCQCCCPSKNVISRLCGTQKDEQ